VRVPPASDFVHILDLASLSAPSFAPIVQTLDLFGDVTGVALSPDDQTMSVGVVDAVYGGVAQFQRVKSKRKVMMELFC
jgi:hypothetical protein